MSFDNVLVKLSKYINHITKEIQDTSRKIFNIVVNDNISNEVKEDICVASVLALLTEKKKSINTIADIPINTVISYIFPTTKYKKITFCLDSTNAINTYAEMDTRNIYTIKNSGIHFPTKHTYKWLLSRDQSIVDKGYALTKPIKNIIQAKFNSCYLRDFYDTDSIFLRSAVFNLLIEEFSSQCFLSPDGTRWHFITKTAPEISNVRDTYNVSYNSNDNGIFTFDPPLKLLDSFTISTDCINNNMSPNIGWDRFPYNNDQSNFECPDASYTMNLQTIQASFNIELTYIDDELL